MNTASLELSKELYELSGWSYGDEPHMVHTSVDGVNWSTSFVGSPSWRFAGGVVQAYDLGFLLRKLPYSGVQLIFEQWRAEYRSAKGDITTYADTPEDAVCKLCVELFKQGVLTK